MEFLTNTTNLSKKDDDDASHPPTVYVMSRYHHSTRLTDRDLTPPGVLKLSSGDCRDLISNEESLSAAHQLLNDIQSTILQSDVGYNNNTKKRTYIPSHS